jgi:flagellar biosynthetic protein FlhB
MAEMDFQERTEQATPKRQQESRRRGQVARSRELNIAAVLLSGAIVFLAARPYFVGAMEQLMRRGLSIERAALEHPDALAGALGDAGLDALRALAPLLLVLSIAAALGAIAIGGWIFTSEPLALRWNRLDPVQGLRRLFSLRGLVEVVKALAKALVIGGLALAYLVWAREGLVNLGLASLPAGLRDTATLVVTTLLVCSAGMLLIAAADVPFQIWSHNRTLRMSRQEIREELKETEGRPEVKSRVRALQQQLANRRMLKEVPKADVVVTNPTHFAVALRYDERRMRAPVVVARGVDLMAERIRSIASEHRVALFEAPLLARALYWTTSLGQEIPAQLYLAVAQVLTYVYRLKAAVQHGAPWPERPAVAVDETLARPEAGRRRTRTRHR